MGDANPRSDSDSGTLAGSDEGLASRGCTHGRARILPDLAIKAVERHTGESMAIEGALLYCPDCKACQDVTERVQAHVIENKYWLVELSRAQQLDRGRKWKHLVQHLARIL